jgi:hypothetical protein
MGRGVNSDDRRTARDPLVDHAQVDAGAHLRGSLPDALQTGEKPDDLVQVTGATSVAD